MLGSHDFTIPLRSNGNQAQGVPVKVRLFKLTNSGNCIIRKTCFIVFNLKRIVR